MFRTAYFNRPAVVKERIVKPYRLAVLDHKLSHSRMLQVRPPGCAHVGSPCLSHRLSFQEVRCMFKARKAGVRTPCVYHLDEDKNQISMEYIDGITMKAYFQKVASTGALSVHRFFGIVWQAWY